MEKKIVFFLLITVCLSKRPKAYMPSKTLFNIYDHLYAIKIIYTKETAHCNAMKSNICLNNNFLSEHLPEDYYC